MARFLIVGGGERGRLLAAELTDAGNAVTITTRSQQRRAAIEATGARCWVGTPDRLATLRGALDGVTVACWLLARASGPREQLRALHSSRLEFFLTQAIDTTVRGLLYETAAPAPARAPNAHADPAHDPADADADADADSDSADADADAADASAAVGEPIARSLCARNEIPLAVIEEHPHDLNAWLAAAHAAIDELLGAAR